jgi:hypothetical protein
MARVCQVRTQQASSSHITSHHITPPTLILRLHPVKDKFVELGIATFDDLRDACLDDDVLLALKSALPVMSFSKFRSAVQRTRGIDSTKLTMFETRACVSLTVDEAVSMIDRVKQELSIADLVAQKKSLHAKLAKYAEQD